MPKRKNNQTFSKQSSRFHQTISSLVIVSALVVTPSAIAEEKGDTNSNKRFYHISSGTLSHALTQFASSSGILLSADAKLTDGKNCAGLNGEYTAEEAFEKLLAGSGLTHIFTDRNTVTLKIQKKDNRIQTNTQSLPTVKVLGKTVYDLTNPYNTAYNRPNASTATKTDTPIMETPMSIQVVPRAVMDDQQVISIKDALQNVSGVQWSPVEGNLYENFILRGFDANSSTARNGIREEAFSAETANLDRIEVLKGPAAMLYGRVEPGGLINRVTKQALFTPYYSVQQQAGSFENYRTTLDATAPINSQLAYRFNLAYQNNNSYRDFVGNERIFLAPSLTWKPTDRTELGLTLEYQKDNGRWDDGYQLLATVPQTCLSIVI